MDDAEGQKLRRENDYLKLRVAELQGDVTDLSSQVTRLQQALERLHGRTRAASLRDGEGPPV
jgi:chaperonin cofactor prefoldin